MSSPFSLDKDYLPDSIYSLCAYKTQNCDVCSNVVYSPVVHGYVHDPQAGKVFCPFGKDSSLNQSVYADQRYINTFNVATNNQYMSTTFGRAPQLDPRPLARIGLTWRTS
jgi:hypothetical protein